MGSVMDININHSPSYQFSELINSMPPIQLLSTDCVMLREYALQMLLKEAKKEMHPLIIDASEYCNTEKLLTHFRNHWKLLIPVSLTGFRFELEDFLNAYRKKIKKGILIVTQANRLPIATQAALMHLVYLQEKKATALKIIFLADSTMDRKLKIFHPEGVQEIELKKTDLGFTQWVIQEIARESYPELEPVPANIVDLVYNFSKGDPNEIRWILNKWYSVEKNVKQENKIKHVKKESIEKLVVLSKVRSSFWNHRAVLCGLMVVALAVGGATHRFRSNKVDHHFLASWHPVQSEKYTVRLLNTTDRLEALHWIAYHPGLSHEQVTSDKKTSDKKHYHVEFGRFANRKEAAHVVQKLQISDAHIERVG
jgi:hypothetical protein